MSWQGIEGHDAIAERFRHAAAAGRLASTYLFVGPPGVGKRAFALKLAQALLCQNNPEAALDPCGQCDACRQVAAGTHPDLELVAKPPDKSFIPLEVLIGDTEHRMREGLCYRIAFKPFMGGRKVAIIDDADCLNQAGANCLLKTLEEPPPKSVLILIGTSIDKQLPTIRSRAQIIRFAPLSPEVLSGLLLTQKVAADPQEAHRLAAYAEGSMERAAELADPELWQFRGDMLARLAQPVIESVRLAQDVVGFVEAAGKDAAPRRNRTRQLLSFAIEFYRQLMRAQSGAPAGNDEDLRALITQARGRWPGDAETAAVCLERSLEALLQVDRNAHVTTLLECWLDDLASITGDAARRQVA